MRCANYSRIAVSQATLVTIFMLIRRCLSHIYSAFSGTDRILLLFIRDPCVFRKKIYNKRLALAQALVIYRLGIEQRFGLDRKENKQNAARKS